MTFLAFSGALFGQFLEGAMVVCFGVSWPFAIYRTWRAKRVEGKSLVFLVLVLVGYISGVLSKILRAHTWTDLEKIIFLYALNAVLVGTDLCLYLRYRTRAAPVVSAARLPLSPPVE